MPVVLLLGLLPMICSASRAIRKAASRISLSHQLHLAERVALQLVVSNLKADFTQVKGVGIRSIV